MGQASEQLEKSGKTLKISNFQQVREEEGKNGNLE